MRLLLIRHGETDWNVTGRYQGQTDVPLNQTGIQQAHQIADRLSTEKINAIYSSDLIRAHKTAEQIAKPHRLKVATDARWRELSFGDWEGMTYSEIQSEAAGEFELWHSDATQYAPPHGETLGQLAARVQSAFDELHNLHADQTIAIISHGGPLQILLCHTLGVNFQRHWQFSISQAALSILSVYTDSTILDLFSDTSHLQEK
jgi:alpha-ribazole phosphatase